MPLSSVETRIRHADAAFANVGWTDALVRRVEAPGGVTVENGFVKASALPRVEFLLCVPGAADEAPYPVAFVDVKAEFLPPDHAVDEAALRAACLRLHVPIAITTNGHQFVLFDISAGLDRKPRPVSEMPSPGALRARWEQLRSLRLVGDAARPLLVPDPLGAGLVRAHEDAAMRAILEQVVRGVRRILVKVTGGSQDEGAVVLAARRLAAAGTMRTTVIVTTHPVRTHAVQRLIEGVPGLVVMQAAPGAALPPGTDAILLDECQHAAAWPHMQALLATAPESAVQVAVAGAPLQPPEGTDDTDAARSAAILAHFGEPIYVYALSEAVHDGWCGALEIVRRDLDGAPPTADDVFRQLLAVDGPLQRALIVCPDVDAANTMARELAVRHARWAERMMLTPSAQAYARSTDDLGSALVVCTTHLPEDAPLADIRILVLLAPERRAAVLLRAVSRAAAISPENGKILLRVLDYVGASRVVPELIRDRFRPVSAATASAPGMDSVQSSDLAGVTIRTSQAGRVAVHADGRVETAASLARVLGALIVRRVPTLEALRHAWRTPGDRRALLRTMPEDGRALQRWQRLADREDADDYDLLVELGWGARSRSRVDRADSFGVLQGAWLSTMPLEVSVVLRALAKGFATRGIAAFDDLDILQLPDVERAGGMRALRKGGAPADLVRSVGDRLLRT